MANKKRLTTNIAGLIIATVATMSLSAQPASRPALVVNIVVDGLSLDYINLLQDKFTDGGMLRIMREGVTITDVNYGSVIDPAAATAIIHTGAAPAMNGVASAEVYDRATRRSISFFLDPATIGNFTNETYSPANLRVSTIGDELRTASQGLSHVYSISPNAAQAIVMAGHKGNSAFWINNATGNWATTTYYKDAPYTIQSRNRLQPLDLRLDTMAWKSYLKPEEYPDLPTYKKLYSFRHTFYRTDPQRIKRYKNTPLVNTEITSIASDYIKSLSMGKGENIDMLNISYTVTPYIYSEDHDIRMEQMDSYIRFDREIKTLIEAIDKNGPGMDKTMIVITGLPSNITRRRSKENEWDTPSGEFSPRKAISLLNMYLIAVYGNGEWVIGYDNNSFFLNQDLIKQRDVNITEIRSEAAKFLNRMAGIAEAQSIDDIIAERIGETATPPRRNINQDYAADIYISTFPGWDIVDDGTVAPDTNEYPKIQRQTAPVAPAFIFAPGIDAQVITAPVDPRAIAPTIASILRIRSPNAATQSPLRINFKISKH
ncbi:MAG: alkaline phosphatase family protein [Muribaculaceae bacterium]